MPTYPECNESNDKSYQVIHLVEKLVINEEDISQVGNT